MTQHTIFYRILTFILFLTVTQLKAQELNVTNQKKIDSLQGRFTTSKMVKDKVDALFQIAKLYQVTDLQKSESVSNNILSLSQKSNYRVGVGLYHLVNSQNYITKGEYGLALDEATKAEGIFKKQEERARYLDAIYVRAFSLTLLKGNDTGLKLVTNALTNKKYQSYQEQIGQLYYFLSFYYLNIEKNLAKALYNSEIALENYRVVNSGGVLKIYYNIAQIYISLNNFKKAEEYALLALNSKRQKAIELLQALHSILAFVNLESKNYVLAQKYCDQSLKYCAILGNDDVTSISLLTSLEIDKVLNRTDSMMIKADKVLQLSEMNESKVLGHYYKGIAFYKKKDFEKAKMYLTKASTFIDKNDQVNYKEVYEGLSNTFKSLNQFEEALTYRELFQSLQQQDFSQQKEDKINELQVKFQTKEKEIEIKNTKILEQKRQIDNQREKYILIFVIVLGILIILFYYYTNNKILIKNKELKENNVIINKKNHKIEILLREIHHRVKNNMQIIMSLISIQANCEESDKMELFIDKMYNRILSMSLIHKTLYQSESLDEIDFKEYLKQLVSHLKSGLTSNTCSVCFNLRFKNVFFDLDHAIPLGLILNELISNSYKHAFPKQTEGSINIKIQQLDASDYFLEYKDDGVGYEDSSLQNNTLGVELVSLLTAQLNGTFTKVDTKIGTHYTITFKVVSK